MKGYKFLLIAALAMAGCTNNSTMKDKINLYAPRLKPGEDLQAGIAGVAIINQHMYRFRSAIT